MEKPEVIVICGPTASGKTEKALELAESLNGEIVSVDSVQVYRHLDIGTAKPDRAVLERYPHQLINVINPDERLNAQDFAGLAKTAIRDILDRGKLPLLTGGTGLYFKALLEGLFEGPKADSGIREKYRLMAEERGAGAVHEHLARLDPEAAHGIHPHNLHRTIRAIEVCEKTGGRVSDIKKQQAHESRYTIRQVYFLNPARDVLYANIDNRADRMFERGLVEEVRWLLNKYGPSVKAFNAIGYKEVLAYLQGRVALEQARELIKKNTRHYAKRQVTWFANQKMI